MEQKSKKVFDSLLEKAGRGLRGLVDGMCARLSAVMNSVDSPERRRRIIIIVFFTGLALIALNVYRMQRRAVEDTVPAEVGAATAADSLGGGFNLDIN